jgi:hypothetical protein
MDSPAVPTMRDGAGQLVTLKGAAEAIKYFGYLWAEGTFDCGPQDYEFMVRECLVERCLIFGH